MVYRVRVEMALAINVRTKALPCGTAYVPIRPPAASPSINERGSITTKFLGNSFFSSYSPCEYSTWLYGPCEYSCGGSVPYKHKSVPI